MNWKQPYNIEFKGLDNGLHHFNFTVDDKFFTHFDSSLVEKGDIEAKIVLEKQSRFLKMDLQLEGIAELVCDKCLDNYNQPINYRGDIYIKFGNVDEHVDDDDVVWIEHDEHQLNVAQILYEYIIISLPIKHVHADENDCNQEMLDKIEEYQKPEEVEKEIDPRWDALKNLNINN